MPQQFLPGLRAKPASLYIVHPCGQNKPCKVGITERSVKERLQALQTGSPVRLSMSYRFSFLTFSEAYIAEQATLQRFRNKRQIGEWIDEDATEIAQTIPKICQDTFPLFEQAFPNIAAIHCKLVIDHDPLAADLRPPSFPSDKPGGQILRRGLTITAIRLFVRHILYGLKPPEAFVDSLKTVLPEERKAFEREGININVLQSALQEAASR